MKLFLAAIFLLSVSACMTKPTKLDKNEEKAMYFQQIGVAEMLRNNYRNALLNLREAKKHQPKDASIINNLGLAYFGLKEYQSAEKEFLEAIDVQPDFTDAKNNLGALYVTVGKHKEAIKYLKAATNDLVYNKPAQAWMNLGLAYFHSNEFKNSERSFLKALEFQPEHCRATYYYARSLYEKKSFKLAASTFDRAVDRCGTFDEPFFYGAMSYIALKDTAQAAGRLRELVANYPKSNYISRAKTLLEKLQ